MAEMRHEKCMTTRKENGQLIRHGRTRNNIKMDLKKTDEDVCRIHLA